MTIAMVAFSCVWAGAIAGYFAGALFRVASDADDQDEAAFAALVKKRGGTIVNYESNSEDEPVEQEKVKEHASS